MTTPVLYEHQNANAPLRSNRLRFWGYPDRSQKIRLIAIHSSESAFDMIGADSGAESVARHQSTTDRPSSYHRIVDRDSTVVCLPDEATAFGVGNLNSPTLHLSFALRATDWSDPQRARAAMPMLHRGADVAAQWCREYGIPLTWLSKDQAFGTGRGFVRHGTADPGRRSDPGKDFPAGLFFDLIADRLRPATPTNNQEEDEMTPQDWTRLEKLVDDRIRLVLRGEGADGKASGHANLRDVSERLARIETALVGPDVPS